MFGDDEGEEGGDDDEGEEGGEGILFLQYINGYS